jgi:hypothetical protein
MRLNTLGDELDRFNPPRPITLPELARLKAPLDDEAERREIAAASCAQEAMHGRP